MTINELKVVDLLDEIEYRLRRIIREEVRTALRESKNPSSKIKSTQKSETENPEINKEFPTLLTASEVTELLGLSVARVYELTRTRKSHGFPVIIIGERSYRFSREAILAWIQQEHE